MDNIEWKKPQDKMPPNGKSILVAYKNSNNKNRLIKGHYTEKFTDENYDSDGEFYEYDKKSDNNYVPCGWYEDSYSHEEYSGYWLESQEVLFWAELPKSPIIEG